MKQVEFYSSVGGSGFIVGMLRAWKDAGWRVVQQHALTGADYRKRRGGLGRVALRWRMYGGFAWTCWRAARRGRNDGRFSVVTTNPFFLPALVRRAAGGRGATIQLLYDLYPDALIAAGVFRPRSMSARLCAGVTRYALQQCAATVFLGRRLREHAESAYGPARRGVIIPVGADGTPFRDHEPAENTDGTTPTILYCGQLGRMHEVDTILQVLPTAAARGFNWRFHAGGSGCTRLRAQIRSTRGVSVEGPLDEASWCETMRAAAIALVTIARGGEKVVMPSKTYSAMVAGQAILAVCVHASDLADLVLEHDCGWVIEPGDHAGLMALLERLVNSPGEILAKRRNAHRAGHKFYDTAPVAKQWLELFRQIDAA